MIDPNNKPPSAPLPADKQPILISNSQLNNMDTSKSGDGKLSTSPWAKMFTSGATEEELKMFIQTYLKDLMAEIKRSDQKHKENLDEQKRHMQDG